MAGELPGCPTAVLNDEFGSGSKDSNLRSKGYEPIEMTRLLHPAIV